MAIEANTKPLSDAAPAAERRGLLDLMPGEEKLAEVDGADSGRFILTGRRVIYTGGEGDHALFASARLRDITSVQLSRRPRDRRSAWWGAIGLAAAIIVWQVTTPRSVGAVAGIVVGLLSLGLLADYWFRPAGVSLTFNTPGGSVSGPVDGGDVADAEEFVARVEEQRREAAIMPQVPYVHHDGRPQQASRINYPPV